MDKIKKQELHEIFQKAKQGEANALNELHEKYHKLFYSIAFSILKNKEDSEDVVQIVFLKIFQTDKDKLPTANEASWLYSLTKNETLNYLRKKKQEVNIDEIYYMSEEDNELNKIIDNDSYNRIITKLDKQAQEIVSLKILSNMSFREISLLLNMPMGTVQWKYYTSLYTLRLLLGNISMVIIGILIFVKANLSNKKMEQNSENVENESESGEGKNEQFENEINSSKENETDSTISSDNLLDNIAENVIDNTDAFTQNEIIEIEEAQENNYENTNYNIGILSFTGIFLVFTIIFTIIFVKHQQMTHKNVSK